MIDSYSLTIAVMKSVVRMAVGVTLLVGLVAGSILLAKVLR